MCGIIQLKKGNAIKKIFKRDKGEYVFDKDKSPIAKYDYIITPLSCGKSFSQIASENNTTRQAIHYKFKTLCKELEKIEPKIKRLYSEFDTFLDLKTIIQPEWLIIIKKLILTKNSNIVSSPLVEGFGVVT